MGRPSKFKPEFVEQAGKLALLGATDKQVADFFSVTEETVNNWKKDYPGFFQSLKAGKDTLDAQVERSLYHRAMGYSHEAVKIFQYEGNPVIVPYTERFPPDPTSMIFWLKNRQPKDWRDKQELEHAGGINLTVTIRDHVATDKS